MIVNNCITVFHKSIDNTTRLEKWTRFNYGTKDNYTVWAHGGLGARFNKGFSEANDLQIRIPYELNPAVNIANFEIDDMVVLDEVKQDINTQKDLKDYTVFKIRSITDNKTGNNTHIHIGC